MELLALRMLSCELFGFSVIDANQTAAEPEDAANNQSNDYDEEPLGTSLGIFAAILFGSIALIFIMIGVCILTHTIYMRCFKKEKVFASKTTWFVEQEEEVKKEPTTAKRRPRPESDSDMSGSISSKSRHSPSISSADSGDKTPVKRPLASSPPPPPPPPPSVPAETTLDKVNPAYQPDENEYAEIETSSRKPPTERPQDIYIEITRF